MTTNPLAKHYPKLTPDERFRVFAAADARGDAAEAARVLGAAARLTVRMPDTAPMVAAWEYVRLAHLAACHDAAAFYWKSVAAAEAAGGPVELADGPDEAFMLAAHMVLATRDGLAAFGVLLGADLAPLLAADPAYGPLAEAFAAAADDVLDAADRVHASGQPVLTADAVGRQLWVLFDRSCRHWQPVPPPGTRRA